MPELFTAVVLLLAGMGILVYASEKTIEYSVGIAKALRVSPLLIGVAVLAVGTSLPEAAASMIAGLGGHGDVVTGNVFGSALVQITLMLGMVGFFHTLRAKKDDIILLGGAAIVATLVAVMVAEKGFMNGGDAIALLIVWAFLIYIVFRHTKKDYIEEVTDNHFDPKVAAFLVFALAGVVLGAYITIIGAIDLAEIAGIPEFIVALFLIGPSGSLPELAVSLSAMRKREVHLAVGNMIGSNISDLTFGLAAGSLLSVITFDAGFVRIIGFYTVIVSLLAIGLFAWKEKIGRNEALVLLLLYLGVFPLLAFFV